MLGYVAPAHCWQQEPDIPVSTPGLCSLWMSSTQQSQLNLVPIVSLTSTIILLVDICLLQCATSAATRIADFYLTDTRCAIYSGHATTLCCWKVPSFWLAMWHMSTCLQFAGLAAQTVLLQPWLQTAPQLSYFKESVLFKILQNDKGSKDMIKRPSPAAFTILTADKQNTLKTAPA